MPRTVENEVRRLNPKAPRKDVYAGKQCAVEGCIRETRAMSRWCYRHAQQHFRTRHPEGRLPRRQELKPYREIAEFALREYGIEQHPAWEQSCAILEEWISKPDAVPNPYRKHLRRLHEGGATGRAMLLHILAVYGLRYVGHPGSYTDDRVFFSSLGSRFLRTIGLGGYKKANGVWYEPALPGLTCEVMGRSLAEKVGVFAVSFWNRVERETSWREMPDKSLRKTLEDNPL